MEARRWINQSQPQTLVIAVFLLYIDAVFLFIGGGFLSPLGIAMIAGSVGAGWGISNEKKWGYVLGLVVSFIGLAPYIALIASGGNPFTEPIGLMFAVAQVALLLHPMSRDYQRVWFR